MTTYIEQQDGRVLFDTEKAPLKYEGQEITLTGKTLSLYDQRWFVLEGTLGEEAKPCKVLVFVDGFTGLRMEIPLPLEVAAEMGSKLISDPQAEKKDKKWSLIKTT